MLGVIIAMVGVIAAVFGGWQAYEQWKRADNWKRAEFAASEFEKWSKSEAVQKAMLMLDWSAIDIALRSDPDGSEKRQRINSCDVAAALTIDVPENGFRHRDADIRVIFSEFLDGLERFGAHVRTGLVSTQDIDAYLWYWVSLIESGEQNQSRARCDPQTAKAVREFMHGYGYTNAQILICELHKLHVNDQHR